MGRREDGGIGRVAPHLDRWVKTEGRNEETGNAGRNGAAPPPFIGRSCVTSFAWTMVTLPPEPGQLSAQQAGCARGDTRATRRSL